MHIVEKTQVLLHENKLISEASTLGFKPGQWPAIVAVVDNNNDGDGFLFHRGPPIDAVRFDGYEYFTKQGQQLTVFND